MSFSQYKLTVLVHIRCY